MSSIPQEKLEKLKQLLEVTNEGLTKTEFLNSFKLILAKLTELEKQLVSRLDDKTSSTIKELEKLQEEFNLVIEQAKRDGDSTFAGFRRRVVEGLNSLFTKNEINKRLKEVLDSTEEKIREIDEKLSQVKDGEKGERGDKGQDADETKIVAEVLNKIKLPEVEIEDVKGLKEELERLETTRRLGGGGGFSKIAMESKFIDDETPVGMVNGVNKAFTLSNMPNPPSSVKVFVNGSRMRITEDYTLSGTTITFVTAPPTSSIILCDYRK